jgi:nucleoside-diphosphate-sugar epimerase
MRILMTGGSGVLGRASMPLLRQAGHQVDAPRHDQLDLYDPRAITAAARGTDAILHLASNTPPPEARGTRDAWAANDRLRRDATGLLVDVALTTGVECFVFPSLAFIYPPAGPVDESTPLPEDGYEIARSAVDGEHHVDRFSASGGRGVVLRLGMLYGPGTDSDTSAEPYRALGATLAIADAGRAIAAALQAPAGIYNVVRDGERVSNARFKKATGWSPS